MSVRILRPFLMFSLLGLVLSPSLMGQQKPIRLSEPPASQIIPQGVDPRLMTARKLIRFRNYSGAAELLEVVLDSRPDDPVVHNLLMDCYGELKQYFKAEMLARRVVKLSPQNVDFRTRLAELLVMQGKKDEGAAAYREAVKAIPVFSPDIYSFVISSMVSHEMAPEAMDLIDSLRAERADSLLFALPAGAILEREGQWEAAARQYARVLVPDTSQSARLAERRLKTLLEFVDSSREVERVLLELAASEQNVGVTGLLASHYIKAGRFDDAFGFAIRQDSLDHSEGNALLYFLYQCHERKAFDQVIRMAEYIFAQFTDETFLGDVTFRYADALRAEGRHEEAIAVYSEIEASFPDLRDKASALNAIGQIYLNDLRDYPAALACFDSVLINYRGGLSYLQAARSVPVVHLRLGQLSEAREHFQALHNRRLNDDMKESVDYSLALMDFFSGDYDSAETSFRKLMVDYPRGYYVNDALSLVMLITDAGENRRLLDQFAKAVYYSERLVFDSARQQLETVIDNEDQSLADVALFRTAKLDLEMGEPDRAIRLVDRLSENFPESYYLPHGLKMKADILLQRRTDRDEAREIYRYLLENFPNYPFSSDVRTRLREMEGEPVVG